MKNHKGTENFGPSHYDFEFDFDFRFTAYDYILMGLYALFVFPFFLLTTLASKVFQKSKDWKKHHNKNMDQVTVFDSELTMAPYCPWPRMSQK